MSPPLLYSLATGDGVRWGRVEAGGSCGKLLHMWLEKYPHFSHRDTHMYTDAITARNESWPLRQEPWLMLSEEPWAAWKTGSIRTMTKQSTGEQWAKGKGRSWCIWFQGLEHVLLRSFPGNYRAPERAPELCSESHTITHCETQGDFLYFSGPQL